MASTLPILLAQQHYRDLPPKIKSERDTIIKVYAAAAFCIIGLGASIYVLHLGAKLPMGESRAATLLGGVFLCSASGATLIFLPQIFDLPEYADQNTEYAESIKFPKGICPKLSDKAVYEHRLELLRTGSISEIYKQLYIREIGVGPYVRARLLTVEQGNILSALLNQCVTAHKLYIQAHAVVCGSHFFLKEDRRYQRAQAILAELKRRWPAIQHDFFPRKLLRSCQVLKIV